MSFPLVKSRMFCPWILYSFDGAAASCSLALVDCYLPRESSCSESMSIVQSIMLSTRCRIFIASVTSVPSSATQAMDSPASSASVRPVSIVLTAAQSSSYRIAVNNWWLSCSSASTESTAPTVPDKPNSVVRSTIVVVLFTSVLLLRNRSRCPLE